MKITYNLIATFLCSFFLSPISIFGQITTKQFRPKIHFSPQKNWTNDPNGLIFFKGEYHLFFQHNPNGNDWGNMSWGHAKTKDLMHWEELPLAIAHGNEFIFSGCVVWDKSHASGLGNPNKDLLVAIYTADFPNTREEQHLAYSNDDGLTWIKYAKNPILNLNMKDFRDPNIIWHPESNQYVMVVSKPTEFTIQFYSSKDLIHWNLCSEFGPQGDVAKIWECPSLIQLDIQGTNQKKWILAVSSQGPTKNFAGMQYFVGDFDGQTFRNENPKEKILYVDYGKDFYAAIPFYQADKPVWLGWALNWDYAKEQPTFPWKGQMSMARSLSLKNTREGLRLVQQFKPDFTTLKPDFVATNIELMKNKVLSGISFLKDKTYLIELTIQSSKSEFYGVEIAGIQSDSQKNEFFRIGLDRQNKEWFTDRSKSGKILKKGFDSVDKAPFDMDSPQKLQILVDHSVVEVLAQDGLVAISTLRFPNSNKEEVRLFSDGGKTNFSLIRVWELK